MSMKVLTALQLLEIFGVYAAMTLLLPAMLFYKKICGIRFSVRFMIYQIAGNFYMITLVLILQLLHISSWLTLVGCTALSAAAARLWLYPTDRKEAVRRRLEDIQKLAEGRYGFRLLFRKIRMRIFQAAGGLAGCIWKGFYKNLPDVLFLLALLAAYMLTYGVNAFEQYGYCASDVVVHNYWINYMSKGQPFVAGVYPFGFHCIIYYLHTVFGIDTYVLLRLFWVVQTLLIHLMLLAFLRICCRTKYMAYAGTGFYLLAGLFRINTYSRYTSSLPQEFGMIFILPSIAFLFLFFEQKKKEQGSGEAQKEVCQAEAERETLLVMEENTQDGSFCIRTIVWNPDEMQATRFEEPEPLQTANIKAGIRKRNRIRSVLRKECALVSFLYLGCFLMSFSLTLTVHFYNTMIAGLFCLGVGAGYGFRLFGKKYFGRVMLAGMTAIAVSVLPLLLAFLGGTPLEGSLFWGMEIINGTAKNTEVILETDDEEQTDETSTNKAGIHANTETETIKAVPVQSKTRSPGMLHSIRTKLQRLLSAVNSTMDVFLIYMEYQWVSRSIPIWILLSALLSVLFFVLRETDYAARMLSVTVFMMLMTLLFAAGELGLPELMDASGRTCIYYAYSLIVLWCICTDGIFYLLFGRMRFSWAADAASVLVIAGLAAAVVSGGVGKKMYTAKSMQSNDAVICLTNIIRENPDQTWTIVSANDELRMGEDHGYHYELDTFLREMEHHGGTETIFIPTKKVYFFIEKIPIAYAQVYEDSGQPVSEQGALEKLPERDGIRMYQGRNRWIEMSRQFFWAKQFADMYPNEMSVYYETDAFVCYCVEQNAYSLFDFSINYKYNMMHAKE